MKRTYHFFQNHINVIAPLAVIVVAGGLAVGIFSSVASPGTAQSAGDEQSTQQRFIAGGDEGLPEHELSAEEGTSLEIAPESTDRAEGDAGESPEDQKEEVASTKLDSHSSIAPEKTHTASPASETQKQQKNDPAPAREAPKPAPSNTNTSSGEEAPRTTQPVATYSAELAVIGPSGSTRYTAEIPIGATVLDLMNAARASGLSFSTKQFGGIGAYVTTLNGLAEDTKAGMYWVYRVNGAKATAGISAKTLKAGDRVEWRYEKAY